MAPALQQAQELYKAKGMDLATDIHAYMTHGFVFSNPAALLLGRPIISSEGPSKWLEPQDYHLADCWYVKLAIGKTALRWFISRMPWHLPKIAWERGFSGKENLRIYPTETLIKRIF